MKMGNGRYLPTTSNSRNPLISRRMNNDDKFPVSSHRSMKQREKNSNSDFGNGREGVALSVTKLIDLVLLDGQLDIDHIIPRNDDGPDEENNFALTHLSCNRQKGSSDLRVARRIAEFEELQKTAIEQGERGAHLGHILAQYNGAKAQLKLKRSGNAVEYVLLRGRQE